MNLEQHGRIVDEQIRSLRQEFVPQKSMLSDIAALHEEVRQLSNLEIQINSLKDALQELSLTIQVLKDERSSYGSTTEGTPTNMASCAEVAVHETEFEALWSEIGDIRRTLQGMCQEGHGVSVSKTESHSINQTTWRVSVDVPTMDRNYTDEALLCHSKKALLRNASWGAQAHTATCEHCAQHGI